MGDAYQGEDLSRALSDILRYDKDHVLHLSNDMQWATVEALQAVLYERFGPVSRQRLLDLVQQSYRAGGRPRFEILFHRCGVTLMRCTTKHFFTHSNGRVGAMSTFLRIATATPSREDMSKALSDVLRYDKDHVLHLSDDMQWASVQALQAILHERVGFVSLENLLAVVHWSRNQHGEPRFQICNDISGVQMVRATAKRHFTRGNGSTKGNGKGKGKSGGNGKGAANQGESAAAAQAVVPPWSRMPHTGNSSRSAAPAPAPAAPDASAPDEPPALHAQGAGSAANASDDDVLDDALMAGDYRLLLGVQHRHELESSSAATFASIVASQPAAASDTSPLGVEPEFDRHMLLAASVDAPPAAQVAENGSEGPHLPMGSPGVCIICTERLANASFVHGHTAHMVCCLECAQTVQQRYRVCPVCRLPFSAVVQNFGP